MPATEHAFTDSLPDQIFLDCDVVIAALITSEPHHSHSRAFIEQLAEGAVVVYVSSLLWPECANTFSKEQFRARLPQEEQRRLQLDQWQRASVRQTYLSFMLGKLDALISDFTWYEVSFTPAVRVLSLQYMWRHSLRSLDAAQVASADYAGIQHVASLDEAFRRVDGLHLWNDRIHTR